MAEEFRITAIEPQKKPGRYNLFLDGAFALGLSESVVLEFQLRSGDMLTEERISALQKAEVRSAAKEKALVLLTYRSRSCQEMKRRLLEKGFHEDVVQDVVADLGRVGLLDDHAFALSYARNRLTLRPIGRRLLAQELRQRGIDDETAGLVLEQVYSEMSEEDLARKLAGRKSGSGDVKHKKKLADFLVRRGFDWDIASAVIRDIGIQEIESE